MGLGWPEILLLLGLAVLLFGPSRLPGLGKSMGDAVRGFKRGLSGEEDPRPTRDVKEQLDQNQATGQTQKDHDKQRQS